MSNFTSTTNSLNNIVGLSFQLGALGMAINFAGKMIDSTQPRKKKRTYDYFDYNMSYTKPRRKKQQNTFDWDYGY